MIEFVGLWGKNTSNNRGLGQLNLEWRIGRQEISRGKNSGGLVHKFGPRIYIVTGVTQSVSDGRGGKQLVSQNDIKKSTPKEVRLQNCILPSNFVLFVFVEHSNTEIPVQCFNFKVCTRFLVTSKHLMFIEREKTL